MREIKFRIWDLLSKNMINLNDTLCEIPYYELFCHTPDERPYYKMQNTGLKDKNGKEIYEGDILKFYYADGEWFAFGICFYDEETTAFRHTFHEVYGGKIEYDSQRPPKRFWMNDNILCEVVGNKYETPELLKESKNDK